jgi:hypothetical protein
MKKIEFARAMFEALFKDGLEDAHKIALTDGVFMGTLKQYESNLIKDFMKLATLKEGVWTYHDLGFSKITYDTNTSIWSISFYDSPLMIDESLKIAQEKVFKWMREKRDTLNLNQGEKMSLKPEFDVLIRVILSGDRVLIYIANKSDKVLEVIQDFKKYEGLNIVHETKASGMPWIIYTNPLYKTGEVGAEVERLLRKEGVESIQIEAVEANGEESYLETLISE